METCKERIISLELQVPESDEGSLDDTQPPLELVDDDDDDYSDDEEDEDEEEEDTASIVTVQASSDKLFLRSDSDAYGPSSIDSVSSQGKLRIKAAPLTLHQTLAKEQTIVEVLNPVIGGDGNARTIQVSGTPYDPDELLEQQAAGGGGAAAATLLLHSETFVLPADSAKSELSLNAKMKNVLEELLENERVKLNLQKSLEEEEDEEDAYDDVNEDGDDDGEGENIYVDARDDDECAYGDAMDDDVVDFGITAKTTTTRTRTTPRDDAKNGNQQLLDELMRDSNRNTIMAKLASQLGGDDDDDDEDEEDDDDEDEESSDSSEEDSDDSDEELNVAYVQGAQVIENLNTQKLQKSQTYTSIKQAEEQPVQEQQQPVAVSVATQSSSCGDAAAAGGDTLAQLQAEQRALAEISKQLRKSVEDLLSADGGNSQVEETQRIYTLPVASDGAAVVTVTEVVKKQKKSARSGAPESGEAIFNRLLSAGAAERQIFDQQQGETTITTTTTTTEALPVALHCEPSTSVVTTTRTVSNIVSSGIPRPEGGNKQAKSSNNNNGNNNNRGKNKRKGKKK